MEPDTLQNESSFSPPARLVLADDHTILRTGIRSALERNPDLEVIGEAENGRQAVKLCRELCPDLVLMDVRMPEMDGLEATQEIKAEYPEIAVLMLTAHEDPDYMLRAIRAGAAGYVLKYATHQQLLNSIRGVLQGESSLDQELAMRLLRGLDDEMQKAPAELAPERHPEKRLDLPLPEALTPREAEILRLVAQGQTNRQIAQNLSISRNTARNHVQNIIAKLGVSDRTQAAVCAVELGLILDRRK